MRSNQIIFLDLQHLSILLLGCEVRALGVGPLSQGEGVLPLPPLHRLKLMSSHGISQAIYFPL